jgi:hypothetical protein
VLLKTGNARAFAIRGLHECGQSDGRQKTCGSARQLSNSGDEFVAIHFGHADVTDEHVEGLRLQHAQSFFPGTGDSNARSTVPQYAGDECPGVRIIVHHQHPSPGKLSGLSLRGGLVEEPVGAGLSGLMGSHR